jgi:PadR family transcriptional regulator, regulatory protein PadR
MCEYRPVSPRSTSPTRTELELLAVAAGFAREGHASFHGYEVVRRLADTGAKVVSHTTIYRSLIRLERDGFLTSGWEDPVVAERDGRPRRRLYSFTAAGAAIVPRPTQAPAILRVAEAT